MDIKKILFPALLIGGALGIRRLLNAKTAQRNQASNATSYDAVDTYVERQMHRLHIPGLSLAIIEGDKIVHQSGFGRARPGGEVPTAQTPFFIGSLTKSITALAVMQLVEGGKVELDAPIQRYLPWFRVADLDASAQMTVRHLLNQTSGFSFMISQLILAELDNRPDATERQVRALSGLKTNPVGEKWEYCNVNYNILGLIVETCSGESYADYIQNHIFNPLQMSHSYSSKATAQQNGLAKGHRHWFSFPFPAPDLPVPLGSLPSGQLISTAEDIAHYLIAHINEGRFGNMQILSADGIDELHRGVAEVTFMGTSKGKYGMGWFDIDMGQTKTFSHGGNVPDFSAYMALVPEQEKGMVMLLNADPYGLPMITEELGLGVTALLAGRQPAPIKLDFIQWIMRLLPLIPLLQVVGVATTLHTLRQWVRVPALRPSNVRIWTQHILFPLVPNLSLAAILVFLRSNGLIRFMHLFMPDLAWIARICGGFATVWAFLRTGLMLQTLRKSWDSNTRMEDTN